MSSLSPRVSRNVKNNSFQPGPATPCRVGSIQQLRGQTRVSPDRKTPAAPLNCNVTCRNHPLIPCSGKHGMFIHCCCAHCQRRLRVLASYEGKILRCPGCAAAVVVPAVIGSVNKVTAPEQRNAPTMVAQSPSFAGRLVLPWLLLAPAALALLPWMWAGQAVLWAVLGVGLGGLCLLLGQRGRWPVSVRVAASLSLAILGHGLTLASPLRNTPDMAPLRDPSLLAVPSPPSDQTAKPPSVQANSLSMSQRNSPTSLRLARPDLQPAAFLGHLLAVRVYQGTDRDETLLATTADGCLKEFSYPHFHLRNVSAGTNGVSSDCR